MFLKSLLNYFISFLLMLSILLPTALQPFKILTLMFCYLCVVFLVNSKFYHVRNQSIIISLVYVVVGLLWSLYGVFENNQGAVPVLTVMVVYPLILPFLAFAYVDDDKDKIYSLFYCCGFILVVIDLLYIYLSIYNPGNIIELVVLSLYPTDAVIDFNENYFKFTIPNISSMFFLFPFMVVALLHSNKPRIISIFTVVSMIVLVVLSGRRALFITPMFGIFLAYILTGARLISLKQKVFCFKNVMLAIFLLGFLIFGAVNFYGIESYVERIQSISDFANDNSNIERSLQFDSLLDGFLMSPMIGAGAGAAASYTRSIEYPWAYELSYVAFLYQYGLFGCAIYTAGIFYILFFLVKSVNKYGRASFEFAFLSGFITFMIANATNPYLTKFDYMWVIFVPFALINSFESIVLSKKRLS